MSNLHTHYHFKFDFQKVDLHTGGKWLIHGTKHHKGNQLQRNSPVEYPSRESKHDIQGPKITCSIQYSRGMPRGGNIRGGALNSYHNLRAPIMKSDIPPDNISLHAGMNDCAWLFCYSCLSTNSVLYIYYNFSVGFLSRFITQKDHRM